ncbi:hypothetical protein ACVCAH_11360 [Micromonospora sp. LZ34]
MGSAATAFRTATSDVERWGRESPHRSEYVKRYSWTITDPETVAFVAEHSGGRLVDPMAGTGYWAWQLTQAGVDVAAYDLNPPALHSSANPWHRDTAAHFPVSMADAKDSAALHPDRALLLSWPPYEQSIGVETLGRYAGQRVIYIGEDWGGCCGDDGMFEAFERDWTKLAAWLVTAPGRQEVVCADHLEASTTWAGGNAQVHPIQQPDSTPPAEPAAQQQALF